MNFDLILIKMHLMECAELCMIFEFTLAWLEQRLSMQFVEGCCVTLSL